MNEKGSPVSSSMTSYDDMTSWCNVIVIDNWCVLYYNWSQMSVSMTQTPHRLNISLLTVTYWLLTINIGWTLYIDTEMGTILKPEGSYKSNKNSGVIDGYTSTTLKTIFKTYPHGVSNYCNDYQCKLWAGYNVRNDFWSQSNIWSDWFKNQPDRTSKGQTKTSFYHCSSCN